MIELPAIEAVGALPNAVLGQMQRQRRRQPLVARRKPLRRLLDRAEGARFALPDAIELTDPSRHLVRIGSGIGQRDHSPQRMTNDGGILQLREAYQAVEVENMIDQTIAASL